MKHITKLAVSILLSALTAGCVSSYYGQYEREEALEPDTLAMTKEDVIALSKEGIGDNVIISQITATHSYFELNTDDIIALKKAGVSEKVVNAMIKTSEPSKKTRRAKRNTYYQPYSYTVVSGYPWYSPWYNPYYFGFGYGYYGPYGLHSYYPRHYGGYFGGHRYFGGYYGGGNYYGGGHYSGGGVGGHRSFGSHR